VFYVGGLRFSFGGTQAVHLFQKQLKTVKSHMNVSGFSIQMQIVLPSRSTAKKRGETGTRARNLVKHSHSTLFHIGCNRDGTVNRDKNVTIIISNKIIIAVDNRAHGVETVCLNPPHRFIRVS
jgi:hypothetical protein